MNTQGTEIRRRVLVRIGRMPGLLTVTGVVVLLHGCVAIAGFDNLIYKEDGDESATYGMGDGGSGAGTCIGCGAFVFAEDVTVDEACGFICAIDGDLECEADSSCAR